MSGVERCPCCKQPISVAHIRRCFDCGKIMGNHDKYTFQVRENVLTTVHRNCDDPTSYQASAA